MRIDYQRTKITQKRENVSSGGKKKALESAESRKGRNHHRGVRKKNKGVKQSEKARPPSASEVKERPPREEID